jgi:hypothetical protein
MNISRKYKYIVLDMAIFLLQRKSMMDDFVGEGKSATVK